MNIHSDSEEFGREIELFFKTAFPQIVCQANEDLIDRLSSEILATKDVRYGPKPSPESQTLIRKVIRKYVELQHPIPFLSPWGSEKSDGSSIDIAEVCALRTIESLQDRIVSHFKPGIIVNIRLEDVSAPHLFYHTPNVARANARKYCFDFESLVRVMNFSSFINPVKESSLVDEAAFNEMADSIVPTMSDYVAAIKSENSQRADLIFSRLEKMGWKGNLSLEVVNYYLCRIEKLNPAELISQRLYTLARYLSGSLARTRLGIRCDDPTWCGDFIDLAFNPPIRKKDNYFSRRVVYRTIPCHLSSHHMPPWRSKGYLEIDNDGEVCPKLASFLDDLSYRSGYMTMNNAHGDSVKIKCDYILK